MYRDGYQVSGDLAIGCIVNYRKQFATECICTGQLDVSIYSLYKTEMLLTFGQTIVHKMSISLPDALETPTLRLLQGLRPGVRTGTDRSEMQIPAASPKCLKNRVNSQHSACHQCDTLQRVSESNNHTGIRQSHT